MFRYLKALKRLDELEVGFASLKRELENARLDYLQLYDKCRSLMSRIAKRQAVMDTAETPQNPEVPEGASGGNDLTAAPLWNKLTARQKQIQMQVLRRRQPNGGGQP